MSKSNAVLRADSSRALRKRTANVDQTLRAVFNPEFRDATHRKKPHVMKLIRNTQKAKRQHSGEAVEAWQSLSRERLR